MNKTSLAPTPLDGTVLELGIRSKLAPGAEERLSIATPGAVIYYATGDGSKALLTSPDARSPLALKVQLPERSELAYPGFRKEGARLTGTAKIGAISSQFDAVGRVLEDGHLEFVIGLDASGQAAWDALTMDTEIELQGRLVGSDAPCSSPGHAQSQEAVMLDGS